MVVYKITNLINGKRYIGQTIHTLEYRWKHHRSASKKKNTCLARAMRKYGIENFKIESIVRCNTQSELDRRECMAIRLYKTTVPYGYNVAVGGKYRNDINSLYASSKHYVDPAIGRVISAKNIERYKSIEERRKTGEATKLGLSDPSVRKHLSENGKRRWAKLEERQKQKDRMTIICNKPEHIEKVRVGQKKRFSNPKQRELNRIASPHRKSLICIETGQLFISINEAVSVLGVSLVTIRDNANGKRKSKRYNFKWVDNEQKETT